MFRPLMLSAVLSLTALPAFADTLIRKDSPHSVSVTVDRLVAAVTGAGANVFARVNHGAGAEKVGMELGAAELLIFGNPKLGTPALQADIAAGLDLPMRVLVHETSDGGVQLVYRAPATLAEDHAVPADAEVLKKMTGALDMLTGKAVAE